MNDNLPELSKSTITTEVPKVFKCGKKTLSVLDENDPLNVLFKDTLEKISTMDTYQPGVNIRKAKFLLISVHPCISKTVVARILRPKGELKLFSGCDYIIEISNEIFRVLDDNTRAVVFNHELMHCFVEEDEEGDITYSLQDHTVKDFVPILQQYGIQWFTDMTSKLIELYVSDAKIKDTDSPEEQEAKNSALAAKQKSFANKLKL